MKPIKTIKVNSNNELTIDNVLKKIKEKTKLTASEKYLYHMYFPYGSIPMIDSNWKK